MSQKKKENANTKRKTPAGYGSIISAYISQVLSLWIDDSTK